MANFLEEIKQKILTLSKQSPEFSETRETDTTPSRETDKGEQGNKGEENIREIRENNSKKPTIDSLACPQCQTQNFVRRGFRQKKHEQVQLYLCKECGKSFTPHVLTRGKHYPLETIIEAMSLYNLGYSLGKACERVNRGNKGNERDQGLTKIQSSTLSSWLKEFDWLCRYSRYRNYAKQILPPEQAVSTTTLAHQQLFRYRFHHAKCELAIKEDIRHKKFAPLQEYLELVPGECPHQYFNTGLRASEAPLTFSKKQMVVRGKTNLANGLATFVLQSVKERKKRHNTLQKFMLYNDSVTVATEVPVYITRDDLGHMQTQLGFEIYDRGDKGKQIGEIRKIEEGELPRLITGHIDILQIRNGQIHILDYKPEAAKNQPIDQLTLYAMALSRLTGLRLFEFKCAWFDEKDYFEFYPLHALHKPKKGRRRRKVYTWEGVYEINKNEKRIEKVRPELQLRQ